jgi:protein-S-isoprenylcysteine O-methyltransferase Ste14
VTEPKRRPLVLVYAAIAYLAFGAAFTALLDFVFDTGYLRAIDGPPYAPRGTAIAIDLALIALFGVTHSVLARPSVKRALAGINSPAAERATYVLVASATLALIAWQWRAIPTLVWHVETPALRYALFALSLSGVALVNWSIILTHYGEFFGLRQAWLASRGAAHTPVPFVERSLYRYMRHPIMVGLALWMWIAPTMSVGHLLFSGAMTAYILVGTAIEERGLARELGAPYDAYRARVRAFLPIRRE